MNAVTFQNTLRGVQETLPPEGKIDEEFLETHQEQIASLKELFEDKGGIFLINVDEYDMICRLPQTEHLKQTRQGADRKDAHDIDRELLSYCLIWPTIHKVNEWVAKGKPGIVSSSVRKLLELGLVYSEARAKKL